MITPKELRIEGFNWTVEEDSNIAYQGNCYGATHQGTQKIFLDPAMTKQKKDQVLIHEIMHAVFWQHGLCEIYKEHKNFEEEVITSLSMGVYQVLNDNGFLKDNG